MTLKEFCSPEGQKKWEEWRQKHADRCYNCNVIIQTFLTGRNNNKKGWLCDDCYWGEIGEEIEKYPIVSSFNAKKFKSSQKATRNYLKKLEQATKKTKKSKLFFGKKK